MMRTDKKLRYFKRKITELCKENIESDMIKAFFKSKSLMIGTKRYWIIETK